MSKPMKIHFEPKSFSPLFQLAASVAAARDIKPILQNVKIKADKKTGVILQATDTEVGIRVYCADCEVRANGEAIIPTKRFQKTLVETTAEGIELESDESKTIVKGEDNSDKWTLETQSPEEFPDIEEFNESAYHVIPAKTLKEMIRRTVFAADADNAKYALSGVYVELIGEEVHFVATDGRRLAWQRGTGNSVKNHKVESTILPARTLQLLDKALEDDEEDVKIAISANRVLFQYKHITFFSRLVEGRFPDWRKIIPETDDDTPVNIMAGALFGNVKKAEITTSESAPGVIFLFEKGKLMLQGQGKEIGSSEAEMPISYDGPKKQLKLDPKYMIDFLRALEGKKDLSLFLPEGNDPFKITADDGSYVYIVMPMAS